jgi:hypothetical protein
MSDGPFVASGASSSIVGLTRESTISGCNEGIGNGNIHGLRNYMLGRSD